jgi:hypothetical protein
VRPLSIVLLADVRQILCEFASAKHLEDSRDRSGMFTEFLRDLHSPHRFGVQAPEHAHVTRVPEKSRRQFVLLDFGQLGVVRGAKLHQREKDPLSEPRFGERPGVVEGVERSGDFRLHGTDEGEPFPG